MSSIPLFLTPAHVARRWKLPVDEARHIVHEQTRARPPLQQVGITLLWLPGLLAVLGVLDELLPGDPPGPAASLVLRLAGAILFALALVAPRILARGDIIERARGAASRDAQAARTRERAAPMMDASTRPDRR